MTTVVRSLIFVTAGILVVIAIKFIFSPPKMIESITLTTRDGIKIAGDWYKNDQPKGWLILIHMMPATKESWQELAKNLQQIGYASLAIDLRGHGQSAGGPDGFSQFSDQEHQASIQDLLAAWDFLQSKGATPDKTVLIGASIGANLSLQFLTEHSEFRGGILLSPGNYRGIDSAVLMPKILPDQILFLVASKQDNRAGGNNAEQNQQYYRLAKQVKNRHLLIFDGAGHGTDLLNLKEELDLSAKIKQFLENGSIF